MKIQLFIVFKETSTGNYDLYGQLVSFEGELLSGAEGSVIDDGEYDEQNASLTYNSEMNKIFSCWDKNVLSDYYILRNKADHLINS